VLTASESTLQELHNVRVLNGRVSVRGLLPQSRFSSLKALTLCNVNDHLAQTVLSQLPVSLQARDRCTRCSRCCLFAALRTAINAVMRGLGLAQGEAKGCAALWSNTSVQSWARVRGQAAGPLVGSLLRVCA